jgi:hypothetical protein
MIVKRYRNGRVVEEKLSDGSISSDPKVFKNNKIIKSNPRGRPAKNPVRINRRKKKGCGCGKKK